MKIGRNDPCPCGSGKKYKKCCMEKDEQRAEYSSSYESDESEWEPEYEPVYEDRDENWEELEDDDFEEGADEDFESEDETDSDVFEQQELDETFDVAPDEITKLPEISDEETKLVDEWWDEYKKMKNTVKEREHLIAFIDRYPHLVDHLGLHHEVLFELGGDHFENGIYEIFVELLLRIRKEYPVTYKESFEYYDSDLIYWYVAQGRIDEIDPFFDYFREEGCYDDHLNDLIQFFHAINRSDMLLRLLAGTKYTDYISFITANNIIERYIDQPVTDESVQSLLNEFDSEGVDDEGYNKNDMKERLLNFTRPFTIWNTHLPKKRSEASDYYSTISLNFAYFLYKNTELSFISAVEISDYIDNYYQRMLNRKDKRPVDIFCLDRKSIFNNTIRYYDTMFWGCDMVCFIELNALYYYTGYLKTCGNISEEQMNKLQEMITDIYQEAYEASKNAGPEMLSFKQFPLWTLCKK